MIDNNTKKAIITGGTRGFGLAYKNELLKKGYKVITIATKNADFNLDLTNEKGTKKLIKIIKDETPSLVILNAGFGKTQKFENYSASDILDLSYINGIHKALVLLEFFEDIKKEKIQFIVASSIAGKLPSPLMAPYSASKAYISNLIDSLNGELFAQGIHNYIKDASPGNINTKTQTEEVINYVKEVLNSKERVIFNNDIYIKVLDKPKNNWKEFVKDSYDRKKKRIDAKRK